MQSKVSKEEWVAMFRDVGLNEETMLQWHKLFEARHPDAHAAFLEWLGEPVKEDAVRSELLLKLFFGRHLEPGRLEVHLEEYRVVQTRILGALRGTREMLEAHHAEHPDFRYWMLTLRRGELVARARLQWARESLQDFRRPGNKEKES